MKTIATKFLSIGMKDIGKGFILAVLTVIVTGLYTCLNQVPPVLPDLAMLKHLGMTGLVAGVAYLIKNYFTNSNDQFLKKEDAPTAN